MTHPPVPTQYRIARFLYRKSKLSFSSGVNFGYNDGVIFSDNNWEVHMMYLSRSWNRAVSGGGTCDEKEVYVSERRGYTVKRL